MRGTWTILEENKIRRPLVFLAGGFVLGEVLALHAAEMAVLLTVYLSAAACLECRKNRSLWISLATAVLWI